MIIFYIPGIFIFRDVVDVPVLSCQVQWSVRTSGAPREEVFTGGR